MPPKKGSTPTAPKIPKHVTITDDFGLVWAILGEMTKKGRLEGIDWVEVKHKIGINTEDGAKSRWNRLKKAMKERGHGLPTREVSTIVGGKQSGGTKVKGAKKFPALEFEVESPDEDEDDADEVEDEEEQSPLREKSTKSKAAVIDYFNANIEPMDEVDKHEDGSEHTELGQKVRHEYTFIKKKKHF